MAGLTPLDELCALRDKFVEELRQCEGRNRLPLTPCFFGDNWYGEPLPVENYGEMPANSSLLNAWEGWRD